MRSRPLATLLVAALGLAWLPAAPAAAAPPRCPPRLLVLGAFPSEVDLLLQATEVRSTDTLDGRRFFSGRLRGNEVVVALSGIGLRNADAATRSALGHFRCGSKPAFTGIVFSGVSGGRTNIGDVTVPSRWTLDSKRWTKTDATMLAAARRAVRGLRLPSEVPAGDLACVGIDPGLIRALSLEHQPRIVFGGDGKSADPFGGRTFPCIPGAGDVFGCEPCRADPVVPDLPRFLTGIAPFVDPAFFTDYFENPVPPDSDFTAEDMETAAVARVAARHRIPFIAFRALSDGDGDPLMLPGFPFQFFVYRQIAADNAARVTLAFLEAWGKRRR